MDLIRKYKISKITNTPANGIEGEIFAFIKLWLSDLTPYKWNCEPNDMMITPNPEVIYFMNSDNQKVLSNMSDVVYVRWDGLWMVLERRYQLSFFDINILFKMMLKDIVHYPFKEVKYFKWTQNIEAEKAYKNKEMEKIICN